MNNKTNKLLVGVIALQSLILLGQWTGSTLVEPAHAQIPDAGADRRAMLDELKNVTSELRNVSAKVDKMASTLESGKVRVHVIEDNSAKRK